MQYATANREHRLMPPATQIICERCRVSVPTDKLDMKDRCKDAACPLKSETLLAATIGLLAEGVAVTLMFGCIFVWLVIFKTGGV